MRVSELGELGLFVEVERRSQALAGLGKRAQILDQPRLLDGDRGLSGQHGGELEISVSEWFAAAESREIKDADGFAEGGEGQRERRKHLGLPHRLSEFRVKGHPFSDHQRLASCGNPAGDPTS